MQTIIVSSGLPRMMETSTQIIELVKIAPDSAIVSSGTIQRFVFEFTRVDERPKYHSRPTSL